MVNDFHTDEASNPGANRRSILEALSPERSNLREPDTKGQPILIMGTVYNQAV